MLEFLRGSDSRNQVEKEVTRETNKRKITKAIREYVNPYHQYAAFNQMDYGLGFTEASQPVEESTVESFMDFDLGKKVGVIKKQNLRRLRKNQPDTAIARYQYNPYEHGWVLDTENLGENVEPEFLPELVEDHTDY